MSLLPHIRPRWSHLSAHVLRLTDDANANTNANAGANQSCGLTQSQFNSFHFCFNWLLYSLVQTRSFALFSNDEHSD